MLYSNKGVADQTQKVSNVSLLSVEGLKRQPGVNRNLAVQSVRADKERVYRSPKAGKAESP